MQLSTSPVWAAQRCGDRHRSRQSEWCWWQTLQKPVGVKWSQHVYHPVESLTEELNSLLSTLHQSDLDHLHQTRQELNQLHQSCLYCLLYIHWQDEFSYTEVVRCVCISKSPADRSQARQARQVGIVAFRSSCSVSRYAILPCENIICHFACSSPHNFF